MWSTRHQLVALVVALLSVLSQGQCQQGAEAKSDVAPLPRLRGAINETATVSLPAGCAMPLTLYVSQGQRKKDLALGMSVRTGVGDSEEFETETLSFMPGTQVNVTIPIVPCGETLIGIIVRVTTNRTSDTLLLDRITTSYMGGSMRSAPEPCNGPYTVNRYKVLIDLMPDGA